MTCKDYEKGYHSIKDIIVIEELIHPIATLINAILFCDYCLQNILAQSFAVIKFPSIQINSNKAKNNNDNTDN